MAYAFCMDDQMAAALRKAIADSGMSANAIAKETGIDQTTISRFILGQDLRLSRAQKIATLLGLKLVKSKRSS